MAGLRQRLNYARPRGITQPAVVIRNPAAQQFREMLADHLLLVLAQIEGEGRRRQLARQVRGESFGALASRGEDQDGPKIFGERFGGEPRPIAAHTRGHGKIQIICKHFLQGHGAMVVANQDRLAAQTREPLHDILWIRDAPAEHQELGLLGREGDC